MREDHKTMKDREYTGYEIAVIGMSGRFPGAKDIQGYWQNLKNGITSMRILTDEELLSKGADSQLLSKAGYVKVSSMLDDIKLFDASFFGYTPREAALMDPQHRIFLECAWEALESAGYTSEKTDELISVFASASTNTYLLYNLLSNQEFLSQLDPVQIEVSNGNDYLATRVSYKLNLTGPSCTVQTACSSSLVAVHMACQNLLNKESDIAIAGGISIDVRQQLGYQYSDGSIVSPDGYCRAFDAAANGTVFGSGVGIVVLRRLEDALANGDTIFAIIKGSAMNNDGADKVGYTAPSVDGQAAVITQALSVAGCAAETISYVETHGTGTKMGDPIEIRALSKAFHTPSALKNSCAIGSVKTQIGHLAGAAGISSLIKTVLALHNRQIPASLNFTKSNPEIDFESSPFFVNTELKEWNSPLRRAGVSSFGVGGTNVHLVLEEAPEVKVTDSVRNYHLMLLSAKTENALIRAGNNLAESLRQNSGLNPADVAFTLQVGRKEFNYRSFAVCSDLDDVIRILQTSDNQKTVSAFVDAENRPVVFVFPGQSSLDSLPPCGLYEHEPLFRKEYDRCLDILNQVLSQAGLSCDRITRQFIHDPKQPLVLKKIDHFITEYSLASLFLTLGILPKAMIGEDTGEYIAACIAGVMSVEQVFLLYLVQDGFPKKDGARKAKDYDMLHYAKQIFRQLQRNTPQIPFISSGHWIRDNEAQSADYWLEERKKALQFSGDLQRITDSEEIIILLQIGRSNLSLAAKIKDSFKNVLICQTNNDYLGDDSDLATFFHALGQLWLSGVKIDWQGWYRNETRRRVPLPTYPFAEETYWIERIPPRSSEQTQKSADKYVNTDDETQKKSSNVKHLRPDLKTPYASPSGEVEKQLAVCWENSLDIEGIGVDDDFFELGGHSLLITQLFVQVQNIFHIEFPIQILFDNTTIKAQAIQIGEIMAQSQPVSDKPILDQLKATFPTERQELLINYLKNKIAVASNFKLEELPIHINLNALELEDRLLYELMQGFRKDFKLQVFPHEMKSFKSVVTMAQFLLDELERSTNLATLATGKKLSDYTLQLFYDKESHNRIKITKKNKPMVFLHSSPRAGSTLMRTMLAGHSRLFCPPELNMLFFETMREWKESIGFGHQFDWTSQGLHWAIVELNRIGVDEGWRMLDEFAARNITVQEMYAKLQELCGDKILIDKTPPYCLDMKTLHYAEEIVDMPKYILLYRHPYAVMESMLKLRLDKLFSRSLFMKDDIDPYVVVETVWNLANRNLIAFANQIDKERLLWVRFEDLVKNPAAIMKDICTFLEIPYQDTVLTPYDGKKERMMGGLGDPNILSHNCIDPKLADVWKEIRLPYLLDESTKTIACQLGYELTEDEKEQPIDESILKNMNLSENEVASTK
jgi:phthiocerol/phenolphthiocerol synthesis type-I polyketide synthase E